MNGEIMTYTSLIRSALPGISVATAALLIGFTPSSATAATHANAQQSHPIAATHATDTQHTRTTAISCGTDESTNNGQLAQIKSIIPGFSSVNLRNGPSTSCPVIGTENVGDPITYYSQWMGWSWISDNNGYQGWVANNAIDFTGVTTTGTGVSAYYRHK
jgi:uncharacterized protein YgiM (DUF1202 family)